MYEFRLKQLPLYFKQLVRRKQFVDELDSKRVHLERENRPPTRYRIKHLEAKQCNGSVSTSLYAKGP